MHPSSPTSPLHRPPTQWQMLLCVVCMTTGHNQTCRCCGRPAGSSYRCRLIPLLIPDSSANMRRKISRVFVAALRHGAIRLSITIPHSLLSYLSTFCLPAMGAGPGSVNYLPLPAPCSLLPAPCPGHGAEARVSFLGLPVYIQAQRIMAACMLGFQSRFRTRRRSAGRCVVPYLNPNLGWSKPSWSWRSPQNPPMHRQVPIYRWIISCSSR